MITSVQLHNFKNHRSTEISLGRMNVLVGPNGSGKTSVLQALHWVSSLNRKNDDRLFEGEINPEELATRGANALDIYVRIRGRSKQGIELKFTKTENGSWNIPISNPAEGYENRVLSYSINLDDPTNVSFFQTYEGLGDTDGIMDFLSPPDPVSIFRTFDAKYLEISAKKITLPSYTAEIPPRMQNDGSDLASLLAYFMTYDPDTFQNLLSLTQRVIPTIRRIRVRPARIQRHEQRLITIDDQKTSISDNREVIGHELVFDMLSGDTIPAHSVSEGTLVTLAILTALVTVDGPMLILLDDIERGIHPWAQRTLMDVLKELLKERDDLQIVLTTHSPYIVDEVEASDVWVFNTDDDGFSESARLSDHPYAERALEVLTTGEFLSAEGEEWVGQINGDNKS